MVTGEGGGEWRISLLRREQGGRKPKSKRDFPGGPVV